MVGMQQLQGLRLGKEGAGRVEVGNMLNECGLRVRQGPRRAAATRQRGILPGLSWLATSPPAKSETEAEAVNSTMVALLLLEPSIQPP